MNRGIKDAVANTDEDLISGFQSGQVNPQASDLKLLTFLKGQVEAQSKPKFEILSDWPSDDIV